MRERALELIILAALLLPGCVAARALAPTEVPLDKVEVLLDNTIALGVVNEKNEWSVFCSGVAVEGTFLTAHHCLEDEEPFSVRFRGEWYTGAVVAIWPERDLAVIDAVGARTRGTLRVSSLEPTSGDAVTWAGHPLGNGQAHIFTGVVSVPVTLGMDTFFAIHGQIIPGESGGPVVDEFGLLLGISSSTMALPGMMFPQLLPVGRAVRPHYIRTILGL